MILPPDEARQELAEPAPTPMRGATRGHFPPACGAALLKDRAIAVGELFMRQPRTARAVARSQKLIGACEPKTFRGSSARGRPLESPTVLGALQIHDWR
jgi:hypothetical protein